MIIVTPDWGSTGAGLTGQWRRMLDRMTMDRIVLPEIPTYVREKDKRQMPSPQWATMISVIDGKLMKPSELDPATVKFVQKLCKGLTIADLRNHFETKKCV